MTPINSGSSSVHSQQVTPPQGTPTQGSVVPPNGISSSQNTLTSVAPPQEPKGFLSKMGDCVAAVINVIRRVLARLPWVGSYFEIETPSLENPIPPPNPSSLTLTDSDIVPMIEEAFRPALSDQTPLQNDLVDATFQQFRSIESRAAKMHAFKAVISSPLSSQEIVLRFYQALPLEMQQGLKEEIFKANHFSDHFDGHPHEGGFGDYMIHHQCKHRVVQDAVKNYCAILN